MSHVSNIGLAASRRGSQGELWIGCNLKKERELMERKVLRKICIESLLSAREVHRGNYGLAMI